MALLVTFASAFTAVYTTMHCGAVMTVGLPTGEFEQGSHLLLILLLLLLLLLLATCFNPFTANDKFLSAAPKLWLRALFVGQPSASCFRMPGSPSRVCCRLICHRPFGLAARLLLLGENGCPVSTAGIRGRKLATLRNLPI